MFAPSVQEASAIAFPRIRQRRAPEQAWVDGGDAVFTRKMAAKSMNLSLSPASRRPLHRRLPQFHGLPDFPYRFRPLIPQAVHVLQYMATAVGLEEHRDTKRN